MTTELSEADLDAFERRAAEAEARLDVLEAQRGTKNEVKHCVALTCAQEQAAEPLSMTLRPRASSCPRCARCVASLEPRAYSSAH
jgi:hypothetical protein